ncbi:uncharacterized protein LOC107263014 [Cephus cinctus]|uniref:Uncharacterized protein LOC107263014 n=1 Tax=Cephus cinctus TaxID=211228 RepID=A0AAJ7BH70_CEPCN|nr:uncharacterized protein LOC107263014 [Cephus cinctus]
MKVLQIVSLLVAALAVALASASASASASTLSSRQSIDSCLAQDSISCVQRSLYRMAKEFFGKESLEIARGVTLVRSAIDTDSSRSAKSAKEVLYDQDIEAASSVADRQSALENFVGEKASDFLVGRSLRINFGPAIDSLGESARALADSIPQEVRQAADEVVEGRGKKKILKSILPLLLAAKVKIGALATLAYFGIALLAKKAILASLVSIAISAFLGLKSLWSSGGSGHDVTPYSGGWSSGGGGGGGGWNVGGSSSGGWASSGSPAWDVDSHGSYSGQSQAYSGYQH